MDFIWNYRTTLFEVLLNGFFAIACIRASVPSTPGRQISFSELLRFSGRIERLRRTRWQWFSMVALLLVARFQGALPLVLEALVALEFALFLAIPTRVPNGGKAQRSNHAPALGSR